MKLNIVDMIRRKTHEAITDYVKENKTGLAYIYLIMNEETKKLLCGEDSSNFYGVAVAINNIFDFGEVVITR